MISTKLTVVVRNNSLQFIHDEPPSPDVPCGFLLVILVLGLSLNACVFLSIAFTSLRSTLFNRLLAYFSLATAVEDIANVTSSVVIRSSWEDLYHGSGAKSLSYFCAFNATCLQFVAILQTFILALISYERWITLKNNDSGLSGVKFNIVMFSVLVASGVSALPVAFLATRHVEERYSCSPAYVSLQSIQILTASLTILIGHCLPTSVIVSSWINIIKQALQERRRIHNLELLTRRNSPVGSWSAETADYSSISLYILSALLLIFYIILVVPNILVVLITQFYTSYHLKKDPDIIFERFVTNKTQLPNAFRPIETNNFDLITIWARFSFTILSPSLIILIHKEVQQQHITCCKTQGSKDTVNIELLRTNRFRKGFKEEIDWRTPVLLSTSEGLHLRTVVEVSQSDLFLEQSSTENQDSLKWSTEPKYVIEFCDLLRNGSTKSIQKDAKERDEIFDVNRGRNRSLRFPSYEDDISLLETQNENNHAGSRRLGQSKINQRRPSDVLVKPSNTSDVVVHVEKNRNKFFETENGPLDKSSASLLLTLDQRIRKRDQ